MTGCYRHWICITARKVQRYGRNNPVILRYYLIILIDPCHAESPLSFREIAVAETDMGTIIFNSMLEQVCALKKVVIIFSCRQRSQGKVWQYQ